jgi:hypothetical protein
VRPTHPAREEGEAMKESKVTVAVRMVEESLCDEAIFDKPRTRISFKYLYWLREKAKAGVKAEAKAAQSKP